jgi:uncharacterized FAD-dependent dehydrogenase
MSKKIVIVGAGVAGINAATKLVDNGYPGELITIIDMGKDPYQRKPEEVMTGMLGAGGWSDGKLTYHTAIGGQLSKYCGEDKAMELMDQVITNFKRFHPKPEEVQCSNPESEPEFIKPYFGLRLFPVWHVGTDYLSEIAKNWYDYLVSKDVKFHWETKVTKIEFDPKWMNSSIKTGLVYIEGKQFEHPRNAMEYDELIFAVGKSGIDFAQELANQYQLPDEPKSIQIGCRFESPQHHFQKLIDISYDFKLYRKFEDKGVSLRSFCTNNNAAYVAVEETYGDYSYNGHAKKDPKYLNNMTNFGILMEINGIEDPFEWSRNVVNQCNLSVNIPASHSPTKENFVYKAGLYYSPSDRSPSSTSENEPVRVIRLTELSKVEEIFQGYFSYITDFIEDMKKVFPTLGDDFGIYIPEVKYLSPEPLVNYNDLSLTKYPNVHFVGDALSARGITVSGAHGIYVAESLI